jgi:hypothetical protein
MTKKQFLAVAVLLILTRCGKEGSGLYSYDVELVPSSVTLTPGATQRFQGKETEIKVGKSTISYEAKRFTWKIEEGDQGGQLNAVTNSGTYYVYTAPATPGVYHLVLTSRQDPSTTARATITVTERHLARGWWANVRSWIGQ